MLIWNGAANASAVGARAIARANTMLSFMLVRDLFYFNALKGSQWGVALDERDLLTG
jgi:hypothetical protein